MSRYGLIEYLEREPITKQSAVLEEKLGDLYFSQTKNSEAIEAFDKALKLNPSPQQRIRVMLNLARTLNLSHRQQEAFATYQGFLRDFPDYPDLTVVYHKLLPLANSLGKIRRPNFI